MLATSCASLRLEVDINPDSFESFARIAAALALLATYKIGRGSGWHRARQRTSRLGAASGRGSAPSPGPASESKRRRPELHAIVVGLWIVLSLALLAYAGIKGEVALSEFDGLDFIATYSSGPLISP